MRPKVKILLLCSIIFFSLVFCSRPQSSQGLDPKEVAELEEYLIDFSKKIEGHRLLTGTLPSDLNAEKFFSILEILSRQRNHQKSEEISSPGFS